MFKFILITVMMSSAFLGNTQTENKLEKFNAEWVKQLRADCYKMSFKNLENNEAYVSLFSTSEGKKALRGVYDYYIDIKLGLWKVKDQKTKFLKSESNKELIIIISTKLERNLVKEERNQLKGKISKASYKAAKYHQVGTVEYSLTIRLLENKPRIIKGEETKKLNTVR